MADIVSEIDRPDGVLPVTIEAVSGLVAEIKRLRATVEQQAVSLAEKDKEIERLRAGISGLVNCQGKLTRAQVREACAEILGNKRIGLYNQSPFVAALAEFKARAEQAERALAEAVEVLRPFADIVGEAFLHSTKEWRDLVIAKPTGARLAFMRRDEFLNARAFVAEHGSDSREGK